MVFYLNKRFEEFCYYLFPLFFRPDKKIYFLQILILFPDFQTISLFFLLNNGMIKTDPLTRGVRSAENISEETDFLQYADHYLHRLCGQFLQFYFL